MFEKDDFKSMVEKYSREMLAMNEKNKGKPAMPAVAENNGSDEAQGSNSDSCCPPDIEQELYDMLDGME